VEHGSGSGITWQITKLPLSPVPLPLLFFLHFSDLSYRLVIAMFDSLANQVCIGIKAAAQVRKNSLIVEGQETMYTFNFSLQLPLAHLSDGPPSPSSLSSSTTGAASHHPSSTGCH